MCSICYHQHKDHNHNHTGGSLSPTGESLSRCPNHPDRNAEFYCKLHNAVVCGGCAIPSHQSCGVKFIPDLLDEFGNKCEEHFNGISATLDRRKDCIDTVLNEISELRIIINTHLDTKEREITAKAKKMFIEDKQVLKKSIATCESVKAELISLKKTNPTNKCKFSSSQQMQSCIAKIEERLNHLEGQHQKYSSIEKPYTFTPETTWFDAINSDVGLGIFEGDNMRFSDASITMLQKFSANTKEDKTTCWISGITTLRNKLLLADSNNNAVKCVNSSNFTIEDRLPLVSRPWDIAALDNDTAAVTFPDFAEVQIIALISNRLHVKEKFTVEGKCHGIGSVKDKLVISFIDPSKVELTTRTGVVLKTYSTDHRGKALFRLPEYVTLSHSEGRQAIYVSDWRNSAVTKLYEDGTVVFCYKEKGFVPSGLTVSSYGEILVCNREKHRLHLIDPEGKKGFKKLRKNGQLNIPFPICFCPISRRLYVSSCVQNTVIVYQMEIQASSCNSSVASSFNERL